MQDAEFYRTEQAYWLASRRTDKKEVTVEMKRCVCKWSWLLCCFGSILVPVDPQRSVPSSHHHGMASKQAVRSITSIASQKMLLCLFIWCCHNKLGNVLKYGQDRSSVIDLQRNSSCASIVPKPLESERLTSLTYVCLCVQLSVAYFALLLDVTELSWAWLCHRNWFNITNSPRRIRARQSSWF